MVICVREAVPIQTASSSTCSGRNGNIWRKGSQTANPKVWQPKNFHDWRKQGYPGATGHFRKRGTKGVKHREWWAKKIEDKKALKFPRFSKIVSIEEVDSEDDKPQQAPDDSEDKDLKAAMALSLSALGKLLFVCWSSISGAIVLLSLLSLQTLGTAYVAPHMRDDDDMFEGCYCVRTL